MIKHSPFNPKTHRVTRDELRDSLERYSRASFQDILGNLLQCQPTPERLLQWATEHPEKWTAALSIMARLAGYTDTTVSINLDLDPSKLGDAQLLQKLEDLRLRMGVAKDITPLQIAAQDPVHKSDGQLEPITIESEAALDLALEAALESNPKQLADALVRGKKRKQKNP